MVEIVCSSADDVVEAQAGGADRIELCAALELGGLTPSVGLMRAAKRASTIPIVAMVRPRGGGFGYSELEFQQMKVDTEVMRDEGADAIITGILTPEGAFDLPRMRAIRGLMGDIDAVCHRAFDVVPDPFEALEQLIDLGFNRVLTSGRKPTASEGAALLAALRDKAAGRIEVLPACGIRADNAEEVMRLTGSRWVHLAPYRFVAETSCQCNPDLSFSGLDCAPDGMASMTDRAEVERVVAVARSASF